MRIFEGSCRVGLIAVITRTPLQACTNHQDETAGSKGPWGHLGRYLVS